MTRENKIFLYSRILEIVSVQDFISTEHFTNKTLHNIYVETRNSWGGSNDISIVYYDETEAKKTLDFLNSLIGI